MIDYKAVWAAEFDRALDEGWTEEQAAKLADDSLASQYADDCDHAYDEMKDKELDQ